MVVQACSMTFTMQEQGADSSECVRERNGVAQFVVKGTVHMCVNVELCECALTKDACERYKTPRGHRRDVLNELKTQEKKFRELMESVSIALGKQECQQIMAYKYIPSLFAFHSAQSAND